MSKNTVLNNEEIAAFCDQMSMLLAAGIAPRESIDVLISDTENESGRKILSSINEQLMKGLRLHEAMKEAKVFPDYVVKMTAIGEESGNLDVVMRSLANYYDREENIAESIRSAVTYPLIMIFMMMLVIVVLLTKVLPIFEQVFEQLGSEMNGLSLSLMRLGNNISKGSVIIMILLVLLLIFAIWCRKTAAGKKFISGFLNKFPPTRSFYDQVAAGRFASAMALTLRSGMDTYSGLDMARNLVNNKKLEEKITHMKDYLMKDGLNFSEALVKAEIFSRLYSRMVAIGFRSGNIDNVMNKIADNYEVETDKKLHRLISIVEPTLVIILSLVVGLILLSVILPLMGIMSSIG